MDFINKSTDRNIFPLLSINGGHSFKLRGMILNENTDIINKVYTKNKAVIQMHYDGI